MEIETRSHTTTTCSIRLLPDEQFGYKPTWWSRTYWVGAISVEWDQFRMVGSTKRGDGRLTRVSRDGNQHNIHFSSVDDVPHMPTSLRIVVMERMAQLREEEFAARSSTNV